MLLMKEPKKDGPRGRKKKTIGVTKLREESFKETAGNSVNSWTARK